MNRLNCGQVEEQLDLYAAGESDAATRAAVERHLADCPTCAGVAAESRHLQGLLDWHAQAPAGLQRLQLKIDKEDRQTRQRKRVLPFIGRLTTAAALVLLTLGLLNVANGPGGVGQTEEVVAALVLRQPGPGGVAVPAAVGIGPGGIPEAKFSGQRLTARDEPLTVALDRRGQTAAEYRQALKDAARANALPPPPSLKLSLELRNPAANERTLYLNAAEANLALELRGPGVLRLSARSAGPAPFPLLPLRLAPGQSYDLPIRCLCEGAEGHVAYLYWTEPGDYTLRMRLRVPYSEAGTAGRRFVTFEGGPVRIKVVD